MSLTRDNIKIDFNKKSFNGMLTVYDFMDNESYIVYMPSLNLTGYGDTKDEAYDLLMNHIVKDYLEGLFTLNNAEINAELKKLGWERSVFFNKDFSKVNIDENGVLREFNLPAETKIESQLMSVA